MLAPVWRHNTFMAVRVSADRPRQSLRLEPNGWKAIDRLRAKRAGSVSRNTWINEAILEKLSREAAERPIRGRVAWTDANDPGSTRPYFLSYGETDLITQEELCPATT